jgi:predicted amino acid-binding ACT domain protein
LDAPVGADEPILLPTPDGGTRLFQPRRPVTPDVRETIRRAAQFALAQRERTPEQIIQDGCVALERARQEAILSGQAIEEEAETAEWNLMSSMHHQYVISVFSRDRVGIVAEVSGAIAALGGDIADLRQSVLRDYFTMILLAGFPAGVAAADIEAQIAGANATGHASLNVTVVESAATAAPLTSAPPIYLLTARGPDRVGFVAGVSAFCAHNGLNILDLATTVADGRYVMMLMVDVSRSDDLHAVRRQLQEFGAANGLEAVLQHEAIFRATNEVDQ